MLKVIDSVRTIIEQDDIALEALRLGVLNLSAYAGIIHAAVEAKTMKTVKKETIVVTLSRLAIGMRELSPLRPSVVIDDLKVIVPLLDITFERTEENLLILEKLQEKLIPSSRSILVVTQGISEITIIASKELKHEIRDGFRAKPKAVFTQLAGVAVSFNPSYIAVPNALYSIMSTVASKRINIIEVISTYTELMIIVEKDDLELVVKALKPFFYSRTVSTRVSSFNPKNSSAI